MSKRSLVWAAGLLAVVAASGTGGLALDTLNLTRVADNAEAWEKARTQS